MVPWPLHFRHHLMMNLPGIMLIILLALVHVAGGFRVPPECAVANRELDRPYTFDGHPIQLIARSGDKMYSSIRCFKSLSRPARLISCAEVCSAEVGSYDWDVACGNWCPIYQKCFNTTDLSISLRGECSSIFPNANFTIPADLQNDAGVSDREADPTRGQRPNVTAIATLNITVPVRPVISHGHDQSRNSSQIAVGVSVFAAVAFLAGLAWFLKKKYMDKETSPDGAPAPGRVRYEGVGVEGEHAEPAVILPGDENAAAAAAAAAATAAASYDIDPDVDAITDALTPEEVSDKNERLIPSTLDNIRVESIAGEGR